MAQNIMPALRERSRSIRAAVVETYGPAPGRETVPEFDPVPQPPEALYLEPDPPATVDEQLERMAGIGGVVVFDERNRVLCVEHGYADGWATPGGVAEPGESLADAARRETREETNVEVELTGVCYHSELAIEYDPDFVARVPVVVFTGRPESGRRAIPNHRTPGGEPEIVDVDWFDADTLPESLLDRDRIESYLE